MSVVRQAVGKQDGRGVEGVKGVVTLSDAVEVQGELEEESLSSLETRVGDTAWR